MSRLTIGALSAQTNCSVPTIRYYEQIGLLPTAERTISGHRYYRDDDLKRLAFIKRCRDFGFPIEQVKDLAHLFDDGGRPCAEVRDLAQLHLDQVRTRIEEMQLLESSLRSFIGDCDSSCIGGASKDCVIISDIAALGSSACGATTCGSPAEVQSPVASSFAREIKR